MNAYSKTEIMYATKYHSGMEDAWIIKNSVYEGEGKDFYPRIFKLKDDAEKHMKKYIRLWNYTERQNLM